MIATNVEQTRLCGLLVAAAGGSAPATAELLSTVRPTVLRAVADVLGGAHPDFDDTVQQALLAVVVALGAFRGECHPAGYAARIAARVALRARNRARRQRERERELTVLEDGEPHREQAPHDPQSAWRRQLLRALLSEIPPEQASALAQRALLGLTLQEVALASGAPCNTVRSRIRMAREALQARLRARPAWLEELSQT